MALHCLFFVLICIVYIDICIKLTANGADIEDNEISVAGKFGSISTMFNKKLQVEKVEMVKKIIRKYDYSNFEQTHKECVEMGLKVNRPALDRFGEKLQQMDNKARAQLEFDAQPEHTVDSIELAPDYYGDEHDLADRTPTTQSQSGSGFTQFKDRSDEITFELGSLRIRENELLKELTSIKKKRSN